MSSVNPVAASTFESSIGVTTKVSNYQTSYGNSSQTGPDLNKVVTALGYLGVKTIRDGLLQAGDVASFTALGQQGYKFDLVYLQGGLDLNQQFSGWSALAPYVVAIEGPNEPDVFPLSYNGKTGVDAAKEVQADIYSMVKSSPLLGGVPVYETSLVTSNGIQAAAGLGNADYANAQSFFFDLKSTIASQIPPYLQSAMTIAPGQPTIASQSGILSANGSTNFGTVDELTQAKLTLDIVLDQFQAGAGMTYLYQLLDVGGDIYGLFHEDGTPKISAKAFHNMGVILADDGTGTVAASALDVSLMNQPATLHTLLMEKSTGTYDLALWNEAQSWDPDAHGEIQVAPVNETVSFGSGFSSVKLFDPLVGTDPVQSWTNVSQVSFGALDHAMFLELSGKYDLVPATPPSSGGGMMTAPTAQETQMLYRFFNVNTGAHFVTASSGEAAAIGDANSPGYRPDLVAEHAAFSGISSSSAINDPNAVAVYRFFDSSTSDHFYTSSKAEADTLTNPASSGYRSDYTLESSSAFYVHATAQAGDVAVSRFFDNTNGTHFYSGSTQETSALQTPGSGSYRPDLSFEGVVFYAPSAK